MKRTNVWLFLTLIGLGLMEMTPVNAEVTHEELRGTLQSLIYSYNQLDNKLERHEHRERALGELMKKAMQALQKGQKNLEPINGIFGRLDDRVSQIETMLITQEDKYNVQAQKLNSALEIIFKWMHENNECLNRPPIPFNAPIKTPSEPAIPPEFVQNQEKTNQKLLEAINGIQKSVQKLMDTSQSMVEQTEVAFRSVPSTAEMLTKIEDKLFSYSVATTVPPPPIVAINNQEFENKVLEKFIELSAELKALPKPIDGLTTEDRDYIHGLANETLNALTTAKTDAIKATDDALRATTAILEQTMGKNDENLKGVLEKVDKSSEKIELFSTNMNDSYSKLNEGLEIFNKLNNVLMTNSELVLDTQRKVEFGTIQVVQKLSNTLDKHREDLTEFLKTRFNNVDEIMITNQIEIMQNFTNLIETEISHVWRQIEIMGSEISDSKDLIGLMNGRNEVYVNSTLNSVDTMGNKVEQIKGRMLDMDSNLNFLLGKLSIMSQEFSNIKKGLAESLEELRTTFQKMHDKMPARGRGPHTIAKNEYDTEVNLLQKRHARNLGV